MGLLGDVDPVWLHVPAAVLFLARDERRLHTRTARKATQAEDRGQQLAVEI